MPANQTTILCQTKCISKYTLCWTEIITLWKQTISEKNSPENYFELRKMQVLKEAPIGFSNVFNSMELLISSKNSYFLHKVRQGNWTNYKMFHFKHEYYEPKKVNLPLQAKASGLSPNSTTLRLTSSSMHHGQDLCNSNRIHDRLHAYRSWSTHTGLLFKDNWVRVK